jgi:DNA recombination protein RmuC
VADLAPALAVLQRSIEEMRASTAGAMGDLRTEVQRTLGATEQQLVTQTGATQRSLTDLSRQLGTLSEQSARVGDLAKDIGSLQDLLRAPKARGGFGELMLERLLQDCLPATAYSIQHTYRDGSRVDAIVRFGNRIVPIDSKFPSESYTQIAGARDEAERKTRRRSFLQQVRRHIDSVGRYVSPQDSTIDYALMYLPSEAIYYELTVHDADPDEPDILAYCAEHHVIPASPNTLLAYLQVVSLGIRGLAMQERTRDLQQGIAQVRREFERFVELHDQLGKHLDNATKKFDETERALARASGAIEGLAQVPIAAGSVQSVLPLGVPEDEP